MNTENRIKAAIAAADAWQTQAESPEKALEILQVVLADNPLQRDAFSRTEQLLQQTGQFRQLSELYSRSTASPIPSELRAQLLRRHASLLKEPSR